MLVLTPQTRWLWLRSQVALIEHIEIDKYDGCPFNARGRARRIGGREACRGRAPGAAVVDYDGALGVRGSRAEEHARDAFDARGRGPLVAHAYDEEDRRRRRVLRFRLCDSRRRVHDARS